MVHPHTLAFVHFRPPRPAILAGLHLLRAHPQEAPVVENRAQGPAWSEHLKEWAAFLSVNRAFSSRTVTEYRRAVIRFIADTGLDPNYATEEDVTGYLASLSAKGNGRGQMSRALKSYYGWAVGSVLRIDPATSPTARLKIPRQKYGPAPNLDDEQLTRLVIAAAWWNPRWAWAILFAFGTGGRIEALCAVRPEDIRDGQVWFRVAKGNRPYGVELGPTTAEAAQELLHYGHPTLIGVGPGRFRQWVELSADRAGLKVWPHLLRHSYSTRVARETDPKTWMGLMGHADLSQYDRYVATDRDRRRQAVRGL
jgi:integrase